MKLNLKKILFFIFLLLLLILTRVLIKESVFKKQKGVDQQFQKITKEVMFDAEKSRIRENETDVAFDKNSFDYRSYDLFRRFLDIKGYPNIGWSDFAKEAADIFGKEEKWSQLAKDFEDVIDEKSALIICQKLKPYRGVLPTKIRPLFKNHSAWSLFWLVRARIKRNKKIGVLK